MVRPSDLVLEEHARFRRVLHLSTVILVIYALLFLSKGPRANAGHLEVCTHAKIYDIKRIDARSIANRDQAERAGFLSQHVFCFVL